MRLLLLPNGLVALVVASLAWLLAFVLFMILTLEHPFSGDARVKPDGFQCVVSTWEH